MEYNSEVVVGTIEDFEDVFMHSYYKIGEFKYILEAETKIAIKRELIVGIEILLNIIFIIL